ncbi:MAG: hypothetical protein PHE61_02925 [Candidatus Omnitrophica bacterium]|nr:hypothetical protein [Candidatus Omnitrophota bacterium]
MTKDVFFFGSRPDHKQVVNDLRGAVSSLHKGIRFLDSVPFVDSATADLMAVDDAGCSYLIKVFGDKEPERELIALAKNFLRIKEEGTVSSLKLLAFGHSLNDDFAKFLPLVNIDINCYEYHYAVSDGKEALFLRRLESGARVFKQGIETEPVTKPTGRTAAVLIEPPSVPLNADLSGDESLSEELTAINSRDLTVLSKEELSEFLKIEEEFKKIFQSS